MYIQWHIFGFIPHVLPTILRHCQNSAIAFLHFWSRCSLHVSLLSRMTPRCLTLFVLSSSLPNNDHITIPVHAIKLLAHRNILPSHSLCAQLKVEETEGALHAIMYSERVAETKITGNHRIDAMYEINLQTQHKISWTQYKFVTPHNFPHSYSLDLIQRRSLGSIILVACQQPQEGKWLTESNSR